MIRSSAVANSHTRVLAVALESAPAKSQRPSRNGAHLISHKFKILFTTRLSRICHVSSTIVQLRIGVAAPLPELLASTAPLQGSPPDADKRTSSIPAVSAGSFFKTLTHRLTAAGLVI